MKGKKKTRSQGVMLVDLENLIDSLPFSSPDRFSIEEGFRRIIRRIAEEKREITDVFIFAPEHVLTTWDEELHDLEFFMVRCPKIRTKDGKDFQDTTDAILIRFGKRIINLPDIDFLCLVSGDRDLMPLIRTAERKGLKKLIVTGSIKSLSKHLIKAADQVYLFEPVKDEV